MKPKLKGWKEGVMTEDLIGFGCKHTKGSTVRYKRYKQLCNPKRGVFRSGDGYELHYIDLNNYNLIRSTRFLIETNLVD